MQCKIDIKQALNTHISVTVWDNMKGYATRRNGCLVTGGLVVAGSNPVAPTNKNSHLGVVLGGCSFWT